VADDSILMPAYARVVAGLVESGQPERALDVLHQLEDDGRYEIAGNASIRSLAVATHPADAAVVDHAAGYVRAITEIYSRVTNLANVGMAYARTGLIPRAESVVEAIRAVAGTKGPVLHGTHNLRLSCSSAEAKVLSVVSQHLARRRRFDEALVVIRRINPDVSFAVNEEGIATANGVLAEELAGAGEDALLEQIVVDAAGLESDWSRLAVLTAVARVYAAHGESTRAMSILGPEQATARWWAAMEETRAAVAAFAFADGRPDDALALVTGIRDPETQVRAATTIAASLDESTAGRLPDLVAAVAALTDVHHRPAGLGRLAAAAARCRHVPARALALDAIAAVPYESRRAKALALAAGPVVEFGQPADARLVMPSAFAVRLPALRAEVLREIGAALVSRGAEPMAVDLWADEIAATQSAGREPLYASLAAATASLALIDRGALIWDIHQAAEPVEALRTTPPP
jgi:hypothetical protein